jgi:hypothetical protein
MKAWLSLVIVNISDEIFGVERGVEGEYGSREEQELYKMEA